VILNKPELWQLIHYLSSRYWKSCITIKLQKYLSAVTEKWSYREQGKTTTKVKVSPQLEKIQEPNSFASEDKNCE